MKVTKQDIHQIIDTYMKREARDQGKANEAASAAAK
jgi:hypothetical protein